MEIKKRKKKKTPDNYITTGRIKSQEPLFVVKTEGSSMQVKEKKQKEKMYIQVLRNPGDKQKQSNLKNWIEDALKFSPSISDVAEMQALEIVY